MHFFLDALRVKPVSIQLNLCKPNGISKCYQLDQSISALRVVGWYFTFCRISIEHYVSNSGDPNQTPHYVAIDLGLRGLPLCPTKRTLCLYGLNCLLKLYPLGRKPTEGYLDSVPCQPNGISKCYQLDQSISALRVVGWYFTFCRISIEHYVSNSGDPDQTPHSVAIDLGLRCLPLCPTKRTLCLYGLNCLLKLYPLGRKPTEGYLDSVPSLTLNAIKPKLIIRASHSSRSSAINRDA